MDARKLVLRQTAVVLLGQVVGTAAMFGIFALLHKFDTSVLWGGVLGGAAAVLNFFFMAVCASLAADKAEAQDVKGGKALIQVSFLVRYALLFLVLFAGAKSGLCNPIALVVPLIFTRPSLTLSEFFRKSGGKQS